VKRLNWIICERTNRWAAALRFELAARGDALTKTSIHDVRSLEELSARLAGLEDRLALVEVTSANFEAALNWLAAANRSEIGLVTVALLDRSLPGDEVASALREAGVMEIADSPRRLHHIIELGRRAATHAQFASNSRPSSDQTLDEWAMSLLPWQDA
jgi:hypothetical protein